MPYKKPTNRACSFAVAGASYVKMAAKGAN